MQGSPQKANLKPTVAEAFSGLYKNNHLINQMAILVVTKSG